MTYTPGGEIVLAYSRTTERGRFLEARTGRRPADMTRHRLGRAHDMTYARVDAAGRRVVVVWGVHDGGIEVNTPFVVRAAIREPGRRRFGRARVLHRSGESFWPAGRLALAVAPDGTATAAWSPPGRGPLRYPVLTATAPAGRPFAAPVRLDASGAVGDVAVSPAGATLVVWARIPQENVADETDRIVAALRPAGASAFGPAEEVTAEDVGSGELALSPSAAFDPVTGDAAIVWVGRDERGGFVRAARRPM
jgi:hypothetical protein